MLMAADTTLEMRSSRAMATAEAEHDVAAVVQRRPDDIGNVPLRTEPYVLGPGL